MPVPDTWQAAVQLPGAKNTGNNKQALSQESQL